MNNLDALWLIVIIAVTVGTAMQHPAKADLAPMSVLLATTSPLVITHAQRHQWVLSGIALVACIVTVVSIIRRGRYLELHHDGAGAAPDAKAPTTRAELLAAASGAEREAKVLARRADRLRQEADGYRSFADAMHATETS